MLLNPEHRPRLKYYRGRNTAQNTPAHAIENRRGYQQRCIYPVCVDSFSNNVIKFARRSDTVSGKKRKVNDALGRRTSNDVIKLRTAQMLLDAKRFFFVLDS